MAQVALAHGVNANLVHGWRRIERDRRVAASRALAEAKVTSPAPAEVGPFVPVTVEQTVNEGKIEIEVRRGALTMKTTWPVAAPAAGPGHRAHVDVAVATLHFQVLCRRRRLPTIGVHARCASP